LRFLLLVDGSGIMHGRGCPMHFGGILMSIDARVSGPHRRLLVRGCALPVCRAGVPVPFRGGPVSPLGPFPRLLRT
jgi:hypothetical protein